jgi:hypothetical protein
MTGIPLALEKSFNSFFLVPSKCVVLKKQLAIIPELEYTWKMLGETRHHAGFLSPAYLSSPTVHSGPGTWGTGSTGACWQMEPALRVGSPCPSSKPRPNMRVTFLPPANETREWSPQCSDQFLTVIGYVSSNSLDNNIHQQLVLLPWSLRQSSPHQLHFIKFKMSSSGQDKVEQSRRNMNELSTPFDVILFHPLWGIFVFLEESSRVVPKCDICFLLSLHVHYVISGLCHQASSRGSDQEDLVNMADSCVWSNWSYLPTGFC